MSVSVEVIFGNSFQGPLGIPSDFERGERVVEGSDGIDKAADLRDQHPCCRTGKEQIVRGG
jgi:hypothetical protein